MFDLLLWAFKIDKHGIVMTKRRFYMEDIQFVFHTPEMILHTDYFMLLFIKNVYHKILLPEYHYHEGIWEF